MNRQPYCRPPRSWAPKMSPRWVRWSRGYRRWQLRKLQRIERVDAAGWEHVADAQREGSVMIVANHAAHFDSTSLYVAADARRQPIYFLTAWQVFAMSKRWQQWLMQRVGCFSIDRESNDRQAFKWAVQILERGDAPLVIFPEGDIYHTTDNTMPFREGAAAIALAAAKKAPRPVRIVPCGIKFYYEEDPTAALQQALGRLERRLHLRRRDALPLAARIHRLAEAALALREIDYLGRTLAGAVRQRMSGLIEAVLERVERRQAAATGASSIHAATGGNSSGSGSGNSGGNGGGNREERGGEAPERVKRLRQKAIAALAELTAPGERRPWEEDLEDLFFIMQLYSYRGDYLDNDPPLERLAETIDKLEEDVLDEPLPSVKGRRRVELRFGPPQLVDASPRKRDSVAQLTQQMRQLVQRQIDSFSTGSCGRAETSLQAAKVLDHVR